MTIQQKLHSAADHHRSGRLAQAEKIYREILAQHPDQADAMHLLGVLANQTDHPRDAVEWISKAIAIRPAAEFYFNLAGALIPLNQVDRAIEALQKAIAMKPDWGGAHANLGTLLQKTGQFDATIAEFQTAISLEPGNPEFHYNLGNALMDAQRHAESVEAFQAALRLKPNHADALNNLGSVLYAGGRFEEATVATRNALRIRPEFPQALNNLGNILLSLSQFEEAVRAFREAIRIEPRMPQAQNNLGNVLLGLGRHAEAAEAYRQAISLNPHWPEAYNNLSQALCSDGDSDGAIAAAEQALAQQPAFYLARENLAQALHQKGETDQAIGILAQLVAERPKDDRNLNSYGNVLRNIGRLEEAIDCYRRAAEANPSDFLSASNYLFTLQFQSEDPNLLLEEHRKWNRQHAAKFEREILPFSNNRYPDRRLRVGYVSPDFRKHCQALFTNALLPNHDHERFEIFCYSGVLSPDAVTARLQREADVWRHVPTLSDAAIADLIRADCIDVLIDLTMHMGHCRPLILRKPAPVQAAWLAYPGTTGIWAMDYRLTDPYLDPPGFENRYTEKSIHLADTFWCYDPYGMEEDPSKPLPDAGELPSLKNGFFTFGCLNDFSKINRMTLRKWGRLMQQVKHSRLHLLSPHGQCRQMVIDELKPFAIGTDRIEFIERQARASYLAEYQRIDLCLDTLPYNGHTTSLDAFWMGVPVLTQLGRTVVGRAGFSQLTNLQMPDFAAENDEQFIELGQRWAFNLSSLAEIRRTLRDRMSASPLMDRKKFTHSMEAAFRRMWQDWIRRSTE